jgi:hypothetical protein
MPPRSPDQMISAVPTHTGSAFGPGNGMSDDSTKMLPTIIATPSIATAVRAAGRSSRSLKPSATMAPIISSKMRTSVAKNAFCGLRLKRTAPAARETAAMARMIPRR